MAAPRKQTGSKSPVTRSTPGGEGPGPKGGSKGGKPDAGGGKKGGGGKKKSGGKTNYDYNMTPLNPPFDRRMRQIGNPVIGASKIKRGWVQTRDDNMRVNFLFNPSQLNLSHGVNLDAVRSEDYKPTDDVASVDYVALGSSLSVQLLYDRTYEITSGDGSFASRYGVYADVAAWYVMMGMLDAMPEGWQDTLISSPPIAKQAYLFLGMKMLYYGYLTSVSVTYSHWSANMVPVRCAVDLQMDLLPHTDIDAPLRKKSSGDDIEQTLLNDYHDLGGRAPDFGA